MEKVLTAGQYLLFVNLTSFMAVFGGLTLWAGFVLMGLIARRYEQTFGVATYWLMQMIAPLGLVVYLIMQTVATLRHQNMGVLELWIGYTFLTWSAGLCLWAGIHFYRHIIKMEQDFQ